MLRVQQKYPIFGRKLYLFDTSNNPEFKKYLYKGRLQTRKTVKLGTLSQQKGGRSEGFPKCTNPYFEPEIQHKSFSNSSVVALIEFLLINFVPFKILFFLFRK